MANLESEIAEIAETAPLLGNFKFQKLRFRLFRKILEFNGSVKS
jgi:hypothetical protein